MHSVLVRGGLSQWAAHGPWHIPNRGQPIDDYPTHLDRVHPHNTSSFSCHSGKHPMSNLLNWVLDAVVFSNAHIRRKRNFIFSGWQQTLLARGTTFCIICVIWNVSVSSEIYLCNLTELCNRGDSQNATQLWEEFINNFLWQAHTQTRRFVTASRMATQWCVKWSFLPSLQFHLWSKKIQFSQKTTN